MVTSTTWRVLLVPEATVVPQIVRRTAHMTAADARMANLSALIEALNSDARHDDGEEGVRAFTEKRAPRWQGR